MSIKKRVFLAIVFVVLSVVVVASLTGCGVQSSSDSSQNAKQEQLAAEAAAQAGLPNIVNFREKKLLKLIYELRDQEGLVTYTYLENMVPTVVPGRTALGGKLTYVGVSIGYGIPYATQYTNPMKVDGSSSSYVAVPQADPNTLFSPSSAAGTWVMLKDPNGKDTLPSYIESNITVVPFKYPFDK